MDTGITLSATHTRRDTPDSSDAASAYAPGVVVKVLDLQTALEDHEGDWIRLGQQVLQPSPVFDMPMISAAARSFPAQQKKLQAVLVWDVGPNGTCADVLIGAFICSRSWMRWGVPVPVLGPWHHDFCFMGLPLVHAGHAGRALSALFRWMDECHKGHAAFLFRKIPGEGPFYDALRDHLAQSGRSSMEFDRHDRAALRVPPDKGDYFKTAMSNKKRKEYRRLKNRLGDHGALSFEAFDSAGDAGAWCDAFLALEAAGWKGRTGTALTKVDGLETVVRCGFAAEADNGNLLFWKLSLDNVPVAMACGLRRGSQAWLLKIAHDEALARFSPGVLLVLELTQSVVAGDAVDWIDSCADADHPMINHLWRERMSVTDILIAGPRVTVPFKLLCTLETLHRTARSKAATLYHRLKKGLVA